MVVQQLLVVVFGVVSDKRLALLLTEVHFLPELRDVDSARLDEFFNFAFLLRFQTFELFAQFGQPARAQIVTLELRNVA